MNLSFLKNLIFILFLFLPFLSEAQNPDLIFSGGINSLTLRKSTHREIEKLFGKPDSLRFDYSNTNIGACIPFRHSYLEYSKRGFSVSCSSYGRKKTSKRKKWLRELQYNENSGIILNETVECGKTKKEDIISMFPDYDTSDEAEIVSCRSKWNGKVVTIYFSFDSSGTLFQVELE